MDALGYDPDDRTGQRAMHRRLNEARSYQFIDTAHDSHQKNIVKTITLTEAGLRALGRIPEEPATSAEVVSESTEPAVPSTDSSQPTTAFETSTDHHFTVWARFEVPTSLKERIGMQIFVDPPAGVPPMQ